MDNLDVSLLCTSASIRGGGGDSSWRALYILGLNLYPGISRIIIAGVYTISLVSVTVVVVVVVGVLKSAV